MTVEFTEQVKKTKTIDLPLYSRESKYKMTAVAEDGTIVEVFVCDDVTMLNTYPGDTSAAVHKSALERCLNASPATEEEFKAHLKLWADQVQIPSNLK